MRNIKIKLLTPEAFDITNKIACGSARLTQHGEKIKNVEDLDNIFITSDTLISKLAKLPHKNLLQHNMISILVIGASSRFLMQITRHQVGVNFTSASCQYSDYSHDADFVVPFSVDKAHCRKMYIDACKTSLQEYRNLVKYVGHDDASYLLPKALRNVLLISATPSEWQHIISQRVCKRNTEEMRYVMLKIWAILFDKAPEVFSPVICGPFCQSTRYCQEGSFSCKTPYLITETPRVILKKEFNEDV